MSFWTHERDAKLKELWKQLPVLKLKDIAAHFGVSDAYCSMRARKLNLSSRFAIRQTPMRIAQRANAGVELPLPRSTSYLETEARRRNIGVPELIRRIMQTVTKDKMVNAILDDDVPEVEAPAMMIGGELVERVA